MRFAINLFRNSRKNANPAHDASQVWIERYFSSGSGVDADFLLKLPEDISFPSGWMSPYDLRVLYNVAVICTSPFLEIGPWIGRSTAAICAGIRDSASHKTFDIIDFGICGVEEWQERFGYVPDFDLPDHRKGRVEESIKAPGGTLAVLIENLRLNGLLQFTTSITRGDWVTCPHERKYQFVFIDAVHNRREAERHIPRLRENLAEGALVVIDDVVDHDFAELICGMLNTKKWVLTSHLDQQNKLMLTHVGQAR